MAEEKKRYALEMITEMIKAYGTLKDTIRNLNLISTQGPNAIPFQGAAERRIVGDIQRYEKIVPEKVRDALDIDLERTKKKYFIDFYINLNSKPKGL